MTPSVDNALAGSAPIVAGFSDAPQPRAPTVSNRAANTSADTSNSLGNLQHDVPVETAALARSSAGPAGALVSSGHEVARTVTHTEDTSDGRQTATDSVQTRPNIPETLAPLRENSQDQSAERQAKTEQPTTNAQRTVSGAPQSSNSKPRPSKARAEIDRVKAKVAKDEAARVAAIAQPEDRASRPAAAVQPVQEERTRLLGIPLPTGQEIQRCLLAFQC